MPELDYTKFRVIYVDDEEDQLQVFRLNFRRDFDLKLCSSGAAALELLRAEDTAVLLTDRRMPGMRGVELLVQAKEIRSDTVRMVVTTFKDASSILEAVNKGDVYRYVVKPWDPDEMRIAIGRAIEPDRSDPSERAGRSFEPFDRAIQLIERSSELAGWTIE